MLTKIHHIGIVVRSLDEAYAFYRDALSLPVHKEAIIQIGRASCRERV